MMKLLPLICYLILLLTSNAVSRSPEGSNTDTHGTIIHSQVHFDPLTRIQIFDDYVKDDSNGQIIASIGISSKTKEDTSASSREAKDISGSGPAIFTGGFGTLEIYQNSVLLNLPSNSNKSVMIVTNNTDIEAQWQDRDQLLITLENDEVASHEEYEVRVHNVEGLKDKVIISIATNGQRVEIDVNYEPTSHTAMDVFWRVGKFIYFFLFFCMVIGYFTMALLGYIEPHKKDLR